MEKWNFSAIAKISKRSRRSTNVFLPIFFGESTTNIFTKMRFWVFRENPHIFVYFFCSTSYWESEMCFCRMKKPKLALKSWRSPLSNCVHFIKYTKIWGFSRNPQKRIFAKIFVVYSPKKIDRKTFVEGLDRLLILAIAEILQKFPFLEKSPLNKVIWFGQFIHSHIQINSKL